MKKYVIDDKEIIINEHRYLLEDIISTEVKILKKTNEKGEVLNVVANALSNSMGNGNEKVNVCIQVNFKDGKEIIQVNEAEVIRFSLDYHDTVKKAREIQEEINALYKA